MVFNSFLFFGFFAVTGILYGALKKEYRWLLLLVASIAFIAYSVPLGLIFLLGSCIVTYICTNAIGRIYRDRNEKKIEAEIANQRSKELIVLDVVFNLGLLFATKYLNFFGKMISGIAGKPFSAIHIIVPLGISFYTFMILSYAIDVYSEVFEPQTLFIKLLLFASYFPQLINGPISRYGDIKENLFNPPDVDYKRCKDALILFAVGLFKKLCVADNIKIYVDMIYSGYQDYHGLVVFSGAVAYAIFIYADFSGCIDMARGVSKYFGIELKPNFDHPYFAESVDEFWRRWHMTLSSWFKDYLFYSILRSKPLTKMAKKLRVGGVKRLSKILPTSIALLVVWLFTGLWHGANSTYVVWGLYFGLIIIVTNAVSILSKNKNKKMPKPIAICITFIVVCFGYIFFNAQDLSSAFGMIRNIFSGSVLSLSTVKNIGISYYKQVGATLYFGITVLSLIIFIITDFLGYRGRDILGWIDSRNKVVKYILSASVVFFLFLMMNRTSGDFTYMQF